MDYSFSKALRLSKKSDIDLLFSEGKRIRSTSFTLLYGQIKTIETPFKVLISVPKRNMKKAAERNYIKRCIREVLRSNKEILQAEKPQDNTGFHLAIIYNLKIKLEYSKIEEHLLEVLHKIPKSHDKT